MNITKFREKFSGQYGWLLKNNLELLNKMFPKVKTLGSFEEKLKKSYIFSEKHNKKPSAMSKNKEEKSLANFLNKNAKNEEVIKFNKKYQKSKIRLVKTTKEIAKEVFLRCKTRTEVQIKYKSIYSWVHRNKCIDELSSHMPKNNTLGNPFICVETCKIYKNQKDAARELNICQSHINLVLKGKVKSAKGYTFKYIDEPLDKL